MIERYIFRALLFALLFLPFPASACPLRDAVYVPNTKDYRTKTNHYFYAMTVSPDAKHFTLNIIDPATKAPVTRLRMAYDASAVPEAAFVLSAQARMAVTFLGENFNTLHPVRGTDAAPQTLVLRGAYTRFLTLPPDSALDIRYLTPQKIRPGAAFQGRLELVPDTWSLGKCNRPGAP